MNPVQFLSRKPLRRQAVLFTIVWMVLLVTVLAWAAVRTLADRERELQDETKSIASTAAYALQQYIATIDSVGAILTRYPAVQSFDEPTSQRLFKSVLATQPMLQNLAVLDREGVIHATALPLPPLQPGLRPYAQKVLETGLPQTSDMLVGRISHRPMVILGYPIELASGERIGVLGFGLNLVELDKLFGNISLPPGSVITVTDASGHILARTLDPEKFVGRTIVAAPVTPSAVPRTTIRTGVDGVRRVFANVAIARGPWLLSVGIPLNVAYSRIVSQGKRNLTILLAAILGLFVVSFVVIASVTGPLTKLTVTARRIADGDLSPPLPLTALNLEVAQLHGAFDTMAANLRDARTKLAAQVEQERRMREVLESLQLQVVRQERLAAVGILVSGVAHELNNPLQAILGATELLERRPDVPADVRSELEFVKTQSERARNIIRSLSRFSNQQVGPPELVDIREVIAEVIDLRKRDLSRASIAFDVEIASSRPVYANFTEIEQVLLNFAINAQHAIESVEGQKGRVMIRLLDAGRRVRVEVKDDGPGVPPADEPKLFQPFFTTKPVGKGTGLGLSVSYGIIESYGGTIGYRANEWGGATFFFELPAADTSKSQDDDGQALLHGSILPGI